MKNTYSPEIRQRAVRLYQEQRSEYPTQWAALAECVAAIKGAGGLAVVAHPMRYGLSATAKRNLFAEFKALGGDGIEVHSGNGDKNDRLNYALLAERFGFLASAGSDFHRSGDYSGGTLGACPDLPPQCKPVWAHFSQARMQA